MKYGSPIYVRHAIVHNRHVIEELEKAGAVFVEELNNVPNGAHVVFSAHGSPPSLYEEARKKNLDIIDAVCPLVMKVHIEARKFASEGYTILLVGHAGHAEVVGTLGEAPDKTLLIETVHDAEAVHVPDPEKVAVLTQTTLSVDDTAEIMHVLERRFPKIARPPRGDICYATQNRQTTVKELSKVADVILVLGSKTSSNSNRLVDVARLNGVDGHLFDDISELDESWVSNAKVAGLTSGASVPDYLVNEVVEHFKAKGAVIEEHNVISENILFPLPQRFREQ